MTEFTPLSGFIGGLMIGAAALIVLLAQGRIAGISGLLGTAMQPNPEGGRGWRIAFLIGLPAGALIYDVITGGGLQVQPQVGLPLMLLGGLLVGFGTRMGNGCTSGHGVCGIARLSNRSILATATFMLVAALTVFVIRHVLVAGGAA